MRIIMHIVVRPQLSPAAVALACAHGALAGYLRWQHDPLVQQWAATVFYKRIYQAPDFSTWEAISAWPDVHIMTESNLDNLKVAAVFKPCRWHPSHLLNEFPLYGAAQE